jgi:hypothetical protein
VSFFENGTIVWKTATAETIAVKWLINAKGEAQGDITGWMGAPLGEEQIIPGGVVQHFQNGSIYFKWGATQAFEVHGMIRDAWLRAGGVSGQYGFPTSDEGPAGPTRSYRASTFDGGTIYFALGFDPADPHGWEAQVTDMRQQSAGTCVIDSTLSGLARVLGGGIQSRIRSLGGNLYDVYLPGPDEWQRVFFDGTFNHLDPMPVVGALGEAKFWTILMQRAMLQRNSVNWNDLNWQGWGDDFKDTEDVLEDLTGWRSYDSDADDLDTPEHLAGFLAAGDILVAGTRKNGGFDWLAGSVGEGTHQYAITRVYQQDGVWMVQLYNPWGTDGPKGSWAVEQNDGFITMNWVMFTYLFIHYGRATAN